jgi:hypothetical protein
MKNFLIIVLALGLAAAAFLTRPDREEFDQYLAQRTKVTAENAAISIFKKAHHRPRADKDKATAALNDDDIEFKDFYLWTVVREKGGKTLYTGVFDHWVDNELIKQSLPS